MEIEDDTVANWARIPKYARALESALGAGATDGLRHACNEHMIEFNRMAERLYMNWLQTTARA